MLPDAPGHRVRRRAIADGLPNVHPNGRQAGLPADFAAGSSGGFAADRPESVQAGSPRGFRPASRRAELRADLRTAPGTGEAGQTMHVTGIRLRNWKNFREAEALLAPRVFLLGVNAAGKSNFLDALRFMRDVAEHGAARAVMMRGGLARLRSLHARKNAAVGLAFTLDDRWEYELELTGSRRHPVVVGRECVRLDGRLLLNRPDEADAKDALLKTQTALEQVSANGDFRPVADFFGSMRYRQILPQAVRDPQGFGAAPEHDVYGRDLVRQIWAAPQRTREARLRRLEEALRIAVPGLSEFRAELDERLEPHLRVRFGHRPDGGWQDESSLSDGTLRLVALFWALQEKGGPLLLEEPEAVLNEEIVRRLPVLFAKVVRGRQGRQVLAATHSYALLDDPGIQPEEVLKLVPGKDAPPCCPRRRMPSC